MSHDHAQKIEEMKQRHNALNDQSFRHWLEQPLVKLLVSSVPAIDPPETLTTLLRSAFDAGVGQGAITILTEVISFPRNRDGGRS